jgi:hypothetical protein
MALSDQERARVREEELVRLQVHEETSCKKKPTLIVWTLSWAIFLLVLALASPHLHF